VLAYSAGSTTAMRSRLVCATPSVRTTSTASEWNLVLLPDWPSLWVFLSCLGYCPVSPRMTESTPGCR